MKLELFFSSHHKREINLKYCGYEKCVPHFYMPPHTRFEYLIHYITAGEGILVFEGKTYALMPGYLFLIRPSCLVSYRSNPQNPLQFSWFGFDGPHAEKILYDLGFCDGCVVQPLHPDYPIDEKIQSLCEELLHDFCDEYKIQSILYSIFSDIHSSYNHAKNRTKKNHSLISDYIANAKAYIKRNYTTSLTVQEVSEHIGLERSYFSKIFHKYAGVTAQDYILDIRIRQAKILLEQTDFTLNDICSFIGMKDVYYFSRAFKRTVGIAPSHYRKLSKHT